MVLKIGTTHEQRIKMHEGKDHGKVAKTAAVQRSSTTPQTDELRIGDAVARPETGSS